MRTKAPFRLTSALVALTLAAATSGTAPPIAAATGQLIPDNYFSYAGQAEHWGTGGTCLGGSSAWSELDAGGAPFGQGSGSISASANYRVLSAGSRTCVPVVGGESYVLGGDLLADIQFPGSSAKVRLVPYSGEHCSGAPLDDPLAPAFEVTQVTPDWLHFETAAYAVPSEARWVAVDLAAYFPIGYFAGATTVNLDNVTLTGEIPSAVPERLYIGGRNDPYCVRNDKKSQFSIGATWRAYDGSTGTAHPTRLTARSGHLWFFSADNVELTVKVLDACVPEFNDRFWVFIAGMTDVEVEITVEDLVRGGTRTYFNPLGRPFVTITDTDAFSCHTPAP